MQYALFQSCSWRHYLNNVREGANYNIRHFAATTILLKDMIQGLQMQLEVSRFIDAPLAFSPRFPLQSPSNYRINGVVHRILMPTIPTSSVEQQDWTESGSSLHFLRLRLIHRKSRITPDSRVITDNYHLIATHNMVHSLILALELRFWFWNLAHRFLSLYPSSSGTPSAWNNLLQLIECIERFYIRRNDE